MVDLFEKTFNIQWKIKFLINCVFFFRISHSVEYSIFLNSTQVVALPVGLVATYSDKRLLTPMIDEPQKTLSPLTLTD